MYNVINSSKTRSNGVKTSINNSDKEPTKELVKLIEKQTEETRAVEIESDERQYDTDTMPLFMTKCFIIQTGPSKLSHNRFDHVSPIYIESNVTWMYERYDIENIGNSTML